MDAAARLRTQALVGGLAWLALAVGAGLPLDTDGMVARAMLLAVLVLVPLALALATVPSRTGGHARLLRAVSWLHGPAAALASVGVLLPQGPVAGALCVPWVALAVLCAAWGVQRFLTRPWPRAEEVVVDAGLAFLANGALFLAFWRAGQTPLGFPDLVIALTAVHFHLAGLVLPVLAGLAGRSLRARPGRGRWFAPVAALVVVGMPVTAVGITALPVLETVGAAMVATAGAATAVLMLRDAAGGRGRAAPAALLATSGLAGLAGMLLAAGYGLRLAGHPWIPAIETMALVHGTLNAVGFGLLGLLGRTLAPPPVPTPPPGAPWSRLRSDGPVGPDFFERAGAVDPGRPAPRGLVSSLDDLANPGFHPEGVHPDVRAFYEDTLAFDLTVTPQWPRVGFASRLVWRTLGRRAGQMDFPDGEGGLHSRLLPLRTEADGRDDVRGWVRTHADGRSLYAAAYSTHAWNGERYANIAFPLPGGNLTSVLRWRDLDGHPGGLLLTTHPGDVPGDQGVYHVVRGVALRLPINETIRVWAEGDGGTGGARARHDVRVLGLPFLTLHYRMRPVGVDPPPPRAPAPSAGSSNLQADLPTVRVR